MIKCEYVKKSIKQMNTHKNMQRNASDKYMEKFSNQRNIKQCAIVLNLINKYFK